MKNIIESTIPNVISSPVLLEHLASLRSSQRRQPSPESLPDAVNEGSSVPPWDSPLL